MVDGPEDGDDDQGEEPRPGPGEIVVHGGGKANGAAAGPVDHRERDHLDDRHGSQRDPSIKKQPQGKAAAGGNRCGADEHQQEKQGFPDECHENGMMTEMLVTPIRLHRTVGVRVGNPAIGSVQVGGGAPVVVQSMTMTDTADAAATARQCIELAEAGSEMVRVTVNLPEAAAAVPEIKQRMLDAGCTAPLIGDFHYNGHLLLTRFPDVRRGARQVPDQSRATSAPASGATNSSPRSARSRIDHSKPVRIGVNGGSLNQELVIAQDAGEHRPQPRTDLRRHHQRVHGALGARVHRARARVGPAASDQIIISCKVSRPRDLIAVYRELARQTDQPLHLGLTEAGMGMKGLVWSASAMGVLLNEGIGDTIRVSLTPRPGGDRREEVYAACELLQALGLRAFSPSVTACPGCGRTTSSTFQELAERTQDYIREQMPDWKRNYEGVETMTLAVMGCVVNGPGESKAANIGISLPGTGEAPNCPVFIDGQHATTLRGTYEELAVGFRALVDNYVATRYPRRA